MNRFSIPRINAGLAVHSGRVLIGIVAVVAVIATGACGTKEGAKPDMAAVAAPATSVTSDTKDSSAKTASMGADMGAMPMTGDPDHDFLRMMSDHHKGMILMAHETIESKAKLGVKPIAARLDKEQDVELDKMTTMLEKTFKDPYAPKVTSDNQAMADELKGKTGADYDRAFLENVIKLHEQDLKMIDSYLPTAKMPYLKIMAGKMRTMQANEIAEFKKRLAK